MNTPIVIVLSLNFYKKPLLTTILTNGSQYDSNINIVNPHI